MGGHIDCHIDLTSLYSYLAFNYLLQNREILASHNVTVDFIPIFLGGVNVGSGNKPPWTLPAKAKYGQFDNARAKKHFGMEHITVPDFFPFLTIMPQRAMCYIRANFPQEIFEKAWLQLFQKLWTAPHANVTIPAILSEVLSKSDLFTPSNVEDIVNAATEQKWKDALSANTKTVLDQGAFGAPWFWVRNGKGQEEPFFGSDRFHFMWEYLGLPWKDIEILPKDENKAKL